MSYKKILKAVASYLNLEKLERIIAYPVHRKFFKSENVKNFKNKEAFWDGIVESIGKEEDLTYVEFGVWTGVSLKYFFWNSTINLHLETSEGVSCITIGAI